MRKNHYEKRLTLDQFNEVHSLIGGQERVRDMAKMILVKGHSAHDVGRFLMLQGRPPVVRQSDILKST